jgi:hypothetical protein
MRTLSGYGLGLALCLAILLLFGGWDMRSEYGYTHGTFDTWAACSQSVRRDRETRTGDAVRLGLRFSCRPAAFGLTR